jgi:hypothetical protein
MKPFIIVDRKTLDDELTLIDYSPLTVRIVYQKHAFMTKQLFDQWAEEIFFPSVYIKRLQNQYSGEALLIMDGFGAHDTGKFTAKCIENRIKVIFLIPHSSYLTQPLDLVTFGTLKTEFVATNFDKEESAQTNKLVKMMRAWSRATTADLNVIASAAAGYIAYLSKLDNWVHLQIDLSKSTYLEGLSQRLKSEAFRISIAPSSRSKIDQFA